MSKLQKIIKRLFPIHTKEIVVVLILLFVILLLQLLENDDSHIVDRVKRPNYFSGNEDITLFYEYDELGINDETLTFRLDKSKVLEMEVMEYLEYVSQIIQNDIKVQYKEYQDISGAIVLSERFGECKINYSPSPEKYIDQNGWMHYDLWDEEEVIIISYKVSFKDIEIEDSLDLIIHKDSFNKTYKKAYLEENLLNEIKLLNTNYEGEEFELPEEVVFYDKKKKRSLLVLLVIWIGIVITCSLIVYYEIGLKKVEEKNKRKVELTYFINSFTLLYQTGMTIQKSFLVTIENRLLSLDEEDSVYVDLSKIKTIIESDQKFQAILLAFGDYFNMRECRRFNRLLLQTLKQGDDHLVEQLDHMTGLLWEERIRIARKESERASSKLVFPMLLIFIVILIISIVPTFLEVKSIF